MNIEIKINKQASLILGRGRLLINKYMLPETIRSKHVNRLINNKKVNFAKKAEIFSNDRLLNQWTYLINPSDNLLRERLKYNIDINNHIINYDPTGKTLGCGCSFCGQLHRVNIVKEKIKQNKAIINFINSLIVYKTNGIEVEESLYYMPTLQNNSHKNYLERCKFKNTEDLKILKNQYSKLNKRLKNKVENEKKTLTLMSNLLRIPIGINRSKNFYELYKINKAKNKLLRLRDLEKLEIDLLIKLAKNLELFYSSERKIKKLYKLKPKLVKRLSEYKEKIMIQEEKNILDNIF